MTVDSTATKCEKSPAIANRVYRQPVPIKRLTAAIMLFALLAIFALPGVALAAGTSGFGPWFPTDGGDQSGNIPYQYNLAPSSSPQVTEISNFECLYSNGQTIDNTTLGILTSIYKQGFNVFEGKGVSGRDVGGAHVGFNPTGLLNPLSPTDGVSVTSHNDHYHNILTYNTPGSQGLATYLATEGAAIQGAYWAPLDERDVGPKGQYNFGTPGDPSIQGGSDTGGGTIDSELTDHTSSLYQNRQEAGQFLVAASKIANVNPLTMTSGIPAGCGLQVFSVTAPSFGELFSNPGQFFTDMIFYIPGNITQAAYNFIQPKAFAYTFWTPHTERGDTIFNIVTNCAANQNATGNTTTDTSASADNASNDCYGSTPLGFNKARLQPINQTAWYIDLAHFLQWLLSGTYFLILFTAATVYMVRGSRSSAFNVMQLIPRLVVSAILTMFTSVAIGAVITISNLVTKSLLDYNSGSGGVDQSLNVINNILLRTGIIFQGFGSDFSQLIQIIVGVVTIFFFFAFVIEALIRQLALIGVIIFAPVACFCLIIPRWQPRFGFFIRILITICTIPAAMALVFRVGTSMNPIINNPNDLSSGAAAIGVFIFLITLWLMSKMFKFGRSYVTQGGMPNSGSSMLFGGTGRALQQAGQSGLGGRYGSAALRGVGGGMIGGAAVAELANHSMAPLVPKHKGMMAGSGPQFRATRQLGRQLAQKSGLPIPGGAGAGAGGALAENAGESASFAAGAAGAAAGGLAGARMGMAGASGAGVGRSSQRGLQGAFDNHLLKRQGARGERRVTTRQVQNQRLQYQKTLSEASAAKEQEAGHRLTPKEKADVADNLKDRQGNAYSEPQFIRRGGSYFVQDTSTRRPGAIRTAPVYAAARAQEVQATAAAAASRASNAGQAAAARASATSQAARGFADNVQEKASPAPRRVAGRQAARAMRQGTQNISPDAMQGYIKKQDAQRTQKQTTRPAVQPAGQAASQARTAGRTAGQGQPAGQPANQSANQPASSGEVDSTLAAHTEAKGRRRRHSVSNMSASPTTNQTSRSGPTAPTSTTTPAATKTPAEKDSAEEVGRPLAQMPAPKK